MNSISRPSTKTTWLMVAVLVAAASLSTLRLLFHSPDPTAPPASATPRLPVALIGTWDYVEPVVMHGRHLTLAADSTGDGVVLLEDAILSVDRWAVRFGSRDPITERADWHGGYTDGGDASCSFGTDQSECVSMPTLCLWHGRSRLCPPFRFVTRDSLMLVGGITLVRSERRAVLPAR